MTTTWLTTRELAQRQRVSRQWISQQVRTGALTPDVTLANGAYLFDEADYPEQPAS